MEVSREESRKKEFQRRRQKIRFHREEPKFDGKIQKLIFLGKKAKTEVSREGQKFDGGR